MSDLVMQFEANQMAIRIQILLITFFLFLIIGIIFYLFAEDKIRYMKEKEKKDDDDFRNKYNNLNDEQIEFYFNLGQKSLDDIFRHRDNENKTILSHVAIIVAIFSLFTVLVKWSYQYHDNLSCFLPLIVFLATAFLSMVVSVWSMFLSLSLIYNMPPQLCDIGANDIDSSVTSLRKMFVERMACDAKKNFESNIRKMILLDYSRYFQKTALAFLGISFLYICGVEYLSIILD